MPAELLERSASGSSYDAEEGDQEDADIEASIFEQYLSVCDEAAVDADTDALFAKGLLRVQQYLAGGRDHTTCPICLGSIKPTEAIWACSEACYALFHMPCIQEWARNQLDMASYKASRDPAAPAAAREWGCPSCRHDYPEAKLPEQYTCFCGKKEDPEWDPWLAPHSCGELCSKQLPGSCTHSCLLLCHPGPCPPCPLLVDAACFCGKARMKQRCGKNDFSCRAVCGKVMPCGHTCEEACHPGPCAPCPVLVTARCACGSQQQQTRCCDAAWHCQEPCGRALLCGRHHCDQVCHAGPCGPCPEEGERRCPCGKALYPDLTCDQQAPVCGGTCGKLLACGGHRCQERCHAGPCNKVCRELVDKPCRCGRTQKQVLCSADVRCDSKCNNMRGCGRHPCKRRCCDGNCPPCEEVCSRKLRCGNHRCPAPCHAGPCRPCPLSQPISCACGKTSYILPCGAEAAAAPPRCNKPCPVKQTCRHAAEAKPHRCHYGQCPPCRSPCCAVLPCGHTCSSSCCHDYQPPAVAAFERPKPPKPHLMAPAGTTTTQQGDSHSGRLATEHHQQLPPSAVAAAAAADLAQQAYRSCPSCPVPVPVHCVGGHCQQHFSCSSAAPFSCGAACGRPLACGNHTCSKQCHAVAGVLPSLPPAAAAAYQECEKCDRPCELPRSCSHPCPAGCHQGPCLPCSVQCSLSCHCGKTDLQFPCAVLQQITQGTSQGAAARGSQGKERGAASSDPLSCRQVCSKELPSCPHSCTVLCHVGPCPGAASCPEEVTVRCGCRRQKEKWPCSRVQAALAAAGSNAGSSKLYDGSSALKLLPCDSLCAAAGKDKHAHARLQQPGTNSSRDASPARAKEVLVLQDQPARSAVAVGALPASATAAAGAKSLKKLSRAEREALAAAKDAERLKQQRQQQLRKVLGWAMVGLVVLIVGVGLALGLEQLLRMLQAVDQSLQQKYAPDAAVQEL